MPGEGEGEVLRTATQNAVLVLESVMSGETFLTRDPLCWLLGTSVLIFSVLRLIERAFLSKHAAEKYNQYGLESIDFLLFCLF